MSRAEAAIPSLSLSQAGSRPEASEGDTVDFHAWEPDTERWAAGEKTVRYFGDYEIPTELGRGGMGVVYRGPPGQPQPARRPEDDPGRASWPATMSCGGFRRGRGGRHARPSGIVPIYEVGEHDGQHYFSMKLVDGGSLADRLGGLHGRPEGRGLAAGRGGRGGRTTPTCAASSTATSSRPTSWSTTGAIPRSPTSAWPSGSRPTPR